MADGFYSIVSAAVRDFRLHGYDSQQRLERWMEALRQAAVKRVAFQSPELIEESLRRSLHKVFDRTVEHGGALKAHLGVARFTLEKVRPALRAELDRRIAASANLIKLNRTEAIEKTLRRFSGWATSIPAGGSDSVASAEEARHVRKALTSLPFEERRVVIDQSHKLISAVNQTIAEGGGAIAVVWHSHWRQSGYHYREDHKERDEQVYLLRPSWALERGLVKKGPAGYYDEITAFSEEPFCRCYGTYLYALRDLPDDMLTEKARTQLAEIRRTVAA